MISPMVLSLDWALSNLMWSYTLGSMEDPLSTPRQLESSHFDTVFKADISASGCVQQFCLDDRVVPLLIIGVSGMDGRNKLTV